MGGALEGGRRERRENEKRKWEEDEKYNRKKEEKEKGVLEGGNVGEGGVRVVERESGCLV